MGRIVKEIGPSGVEMYLKSSVEAAGGMCEKIIPTGGRGKPDRLVTWPLRMDLVETKRPKGEGGKLSGHQIRDHKRRKKYGIPVFVLYTKDAVDDYVMFRNPTIGR